jgi:hypothetical protein
MHDQVALAQVEKRVDRFAESAPRQTAQLAAME